MPEGSLHLNEDTMLELVPLELKREENQEWYVGTVAKKDFIAMPETWVSALRLFLDGYTYGEVLNEIQIKHSTEYPYRKTLEQDLGMLILTLSKQNWIARFGIIPISKLEYKAKLDAKFLKWLFSLPLLLLYTVLIVFSSIIQIYNPQFFPLPSDFNWYSGTGVNLVSFILSIWILIAGAEIFKYLAALSFGGEAKMRWYKRLGLPFLKCDFYNLTALNKKQLVLTNFAGVLLLLIAVAKITFFQWLAYKGILSFPSFGMQFLGQLQLTSFLLLASKLFLVFKTDLYYTLVSAFNWPNLHLIVDRYLKSFFTKIVLAPNLSEHKKKSLYSYLIFYFSGLLILIGTIVYYYFPIGYEVYYRVLKSLVEGSETWYVSIATFVLLVVLTFDLVNLFVLRIKQEHTHRLELGVDLE